MRILNASGCLDALAAPDGRAAARRVRDEDGHAAAARGERAAADRRDRARDAERDRPRQPGPRALPRRAPAAAARARHPALGQRRRLLRRRLRRDLLAPRRTVEAIELNLSCPNVDEAADSAAEIVAACRGATDAAALREALGRASRRRRGRARSRRGRRRRALAHQHAPRRPRSTSTLRPVLARGSGGLSGPSLKPVALARRVAPATRPPALPIVGHGRDRDRPRRARVRAPAAPATSRSGRSSSPTPARPAGSAPSSPLLRRPPVLPIARRRE